MLAQPRFECIRGRSRFRRDGQMPGRGHLRSCSAKASRVRRGPLEVPGSCIAVLHRMRPVCVSF
jgi:hypothetical protein